jgi:hypothetical protein
MKPLIFIGKEIERRSQEGEDVSVLEHRGQSNITVVEELRPVPLMPVPSLEQDALDCDNSCESRERPNILCNVSSMENPSILRHALGWNRQ